MDSDGLVRSTDLWFDDGTIVLQVETTLYRVYRGLLSSRSAVFRDTFSIPQPAEDGAGEIEGCPVVRLHDREKDFTRFLKALFHCGSHKTCAVTGIYELRSVLRLSDKYDVPLLRESMISILSDVYPSCLDEWLTRSTRVPSGYRATARDCIHVLNVAQEMDICGILPGVMYQICRRHDISEILYGVPARPRDIKISRSEDQKRCAVAIPELISSRHRILTHYLMRNEHGGCEDEAVCDAERLRWLGLDYPADDLFDPLADEIPWEDFDVCSSCLEDAKETYTLDREDLWRDLPRIFDLGTWTDLLA
ncbi:hypothetical protein DFH07DRAFT_939210 [Mycena maculata]|uniref:BTB domain-containing protein n=1 Tax=Mycena maculata TaxID=230809 RepID=A0AAD7JG61_9AGAR|nr:hypothetical protein DFH07DRAFT_939210 [Mycena maculata]